MKKILVAVVMMTMMAAPALAAVTGTAHDLSPTGSQNAATGTTEVCVFCHTPHGGDAAFPLWNRTSGSATGAYSSTTLNASITGVPAEAAACMSCHDGTSLVDNGTIVNQPNTGDITASVLTISADANLGADMGNDHPVGFLYDNALFLADGGLTDPANLPATVPLFGGEMWCSTCHDVHDDTNGQFLVIANSNSDLCMTCHNK